MTAAAKHLTSVTLELGGKSPTIVDDSADLDLAAQNILWGKYTNDGQTCIAPGPRLRAREGQGRVRGPMQGNARQGYGADGETQKASPHLARIVNQRHTERIKGLLDDATSARCASARRRQRCRPRTSFIAPTLLDNIPADAKINREEIFGPLLPIYGYTNLDEVIRRINADPKPLALYVFSRTDANIERVMKETTSGGACINHSVVQYLHGRLPFGGVNNSGIGNAHGHFGFKTFSHERAVVRTRLVAGGQACSGRAKRRRICGRCSRRS